MFKSQKNFLFALFILPILAITEAISDPVTISRHDNWFVVQKDNGEKYIYSTPVETKGTFSKRSDPYLVVSKRGSAYEIMVFTGYTHKKQSKVNATVDYSKDCNGEKVESSMMTQKEYAWIEKNEKDFIFSMKKGYYVTLSAVSFKDTTSRDKYSLLGFSEAVSKL